jgi:hypothetical protein
VAAVGGGISKKLQADKMVFILGFCCCCRLLFGEKRELEPRYRLEDLLVKLGLKNVPLKYIQVPPFCRLPS